MSFFNKILFVSHGFEDEVFALKQLLYVAKKNKAEIDILILSPTLPKSLKSYKYQYEQSIREKVEQSLKEASQALKLPLDEISVNIQLELDKMAVIQIIRKVIKDDYDLVMKAVENHEQHRGLKALDMGLLRKCPCPVWLSRPMNKDLSSMRVAVAIDPEQKEASGLGLSLHLLELARQRADEGKGELDVLSCWDYEFEEYLSKTVWMKISESELRKLVGMVKDDHLLALEQLIKRSKLQQPYTIYHLKGQPQVKIPEFIDEEKVDLLVMGTVARTGIPGFLIGNTAENTVKQLSCSLLAVKPKEFISPVRL